MTDPGEPLQSHTAIELSGLEKASRQPPEDNFEQQQEAAGQKGANDVQDDTPKGVEQENVFHVIAQDQGQTHGEKEER